MTAKGARKAKRDKYMSAEELAAFLHQCKKYVGVWVPAYPFFYTMFVLGLRVQEATLLRWEHAEWGTDGKVIGVNVPTLKQKRADGRLELKYVPVLGDRDVMTWVFGADRKVRIRSPWVFPSVRDRGKAVAVRTVQNHWGRIRDDANLRPGYTSHALRHTAATMLAHVVKDKAKVSEFLRHVASKANATDVYIHMRVTDWDQYRGALLLGVPLKPFAREW